ncbi:MAG: hypothetical protein ACLP9D_13555, partial [Candidatus Bathyarchaeia archaeon]
MHSTQKKREYLLTELLFSLLSILVGILVAVVVLVFPNLPYREFFFILSGAFLGFGSLAVHEFLVGAPERARHKEELKGLLGPLRTKMQMAFGLGTFFTIAFFARSGAMAPGATIDNRANKTCKSLAKDFGVAEIVDEALQSKLGSDPAELLREQVEKILQALSMKHEGAVVVAARAGYLVALLSLDVAAILQGARRFPEEAWKNLWEKTTEAYVKFLSYAMVNERVVTNTRKQMEELRKHKRLLNAAPPYLLLLAGYANNINNDAMQVTGIENFLAKCKIRDETFRSNATKLGVST